MQSLFDQINSEPGNPDDLAHRWQQIPASATWHRTLAVYADNPAAGYGFAGRDNWDEPGHFTISVVVDRASQGTGIGSALLADAIAFVRSHDGSVLHGRVYENDPSRWNGQKPGAPSFSGTRTSRRWTLPPSSRPAFPACPKGCRPGAFA
ncbi:MAG TPA: GNAT family N-acetyltransferase [Symbiobacteriaceae bacterium]|nr:GNAT family N-acetyltransferase [Symbiobacteriaceae bacterium]